MFPRWIAGSVTETEEAAKALAVPMATIVTRAATEVR